MKVIQDGEPTGIDNLTDQHTSVLTPKPGQVLRTLLCARVALCVLGGCALLLGLLRM